MKRFFALICAMIILLASVPAFAVYDYPTIDWSIANRINMTQCDNPWYGGTISSSSIALDAVSRVLDDSHSPYACAISSPTTSGFSVTVRYFVTTPFDAAQIAWKVYQGNATALSYPLYNDVPITMLSAQVNYNGTLTDYTFSSITNFSSDATPLYLGSFPNNSVFIDSSFSNLIVSYPIGATLPGADCVGSFTPVAGSKYQVSLPTPIDPGYSGPASITLQPGNLLIFERSGGFSGVEDITITANDLPISPFIGPWETRNSIGSSATLPDDSTPLGVPYTQWSKVEGSENWLGRSTRGIYSWQISQYTDDYAFYLNPIFGFNVGGFDFIGSGSPDYNPPNVVRIPDVSAFDKIYLVPTINRAGQSYIDYSRGSVLYDVSFDDNGIPEYTPEGSDTPDSDANRPGGATDISGDSGATTQGLIARILAFLESGIDRFASVAEAGRSFLESIASIFSWIPEEIRTVLTSGIIIVIMMAVLSRFI